jgi:hypothetical protein
MSALNKPHPPHSFFYPLQSSPALLVAFAAGRRPPLSPAVELAPTNTEEQQQQVDGRRAEQSPDGARGGPNKAGDSGTPAATGSL